MGFLVLPGGQQLKVPFKLIQASCEEQGWRVLPDGSVPH